MDYYQVSVQCTMVALIDSPGAEWAKREDVEKLIAERDALQRKLDAVVYELSLFGKPSHERIHAAIAIVEGRDNG